MLFVIKFILLIILINKCNCSIIPDGKGIYKTKNKAGIPGVFLTSNYIAVREIHFINYQQLGIVTNVFIFSSKRTVNDSVIRYETIEKLPEYSIYQVSEHLKLMTITYGCINITSIFPTFKELFEKCRKTDELKLIFINETRYYDVYKRNDSTCYSYNNNEDRILKQFG